MAIKRVCSVGLDDEAEVCGSAGNTGLTRQTLGKEDPDEGRAAGPKGPQASLVRGHSPCVCALRLPSRSSYSWIDLRYGAI